MIEYIKKKIDSIIKDLNEKVNLNYHSQLIGFCRTLLAFATLVTLLFNSQSVLFPLAKQSYASTPYAEFFIGQFSIFNLLSEHYLIAKSISILILMFVIIGWRPKITCIFHWWITMSLFSGSPSVDGGDQLAQILTLLLLPICLTDKRKWHWSLSLSKQVKSYSLKNLFLYSFYLIIRLQVCFVYFQAATHKLNVTEWVDGTATYYWFNHPYFGLNDSLKWLSEILFYSYLSSTIITWGAIILELLLFMALIAKNKYKNFLFIAGVFFHLAIWFVHGLFSFFLVMVVALMLYLIPIDTQIDFNLLRIKYKLKSKYVDK